ncbi:Syndecan-4 [Galemys pyrenaicus]|uniref:Syndecan n=1 Tax=Galemys pyrenaicus TaxID=202257 RepID=A0A8J6B4L9_GALPY|nr:Syndecan-4 [Galemys pyrenaicus]
MAPALLLALVLLLVSTPFAAAESIRETEVIDPQDLLEGRYFSGALPDDEDVGVPGQESDDFELSGSGDTGRLGGLGSPTLQVWWLSWGGDSHLLGIEHQEAVVSKDSPQLKGHHLGVTDPTFTHSLSVLADDSEDPKIYPKIQPLEPLDNRIPERTGPGRRVPTEPKELEENEIIPKKISPFETEDVSNKVSMSSTAQSSSIFERTEVLAALIVGGIVGILFAVFLVLLLVYRMKKKDEGSYDLGKKPIYKKAPTNEFYA